MTSNLSKNHIKLITSLNQKKFRVQHQLFVVEGVKGIQEFLNSSFELHLLFSTEALIVAIPEVYWFLMVKANDIVP